MPLDNLSGFMFKTEKEPVPANPNPTFGESIVLYDYRGTMVDTLRIVSDGDFMTGMGKILPRTAIGEYILQAVGHPARSSHTQ